MKKVVFAIVIILLSQQMTFSQCGTSNLAQGKAVTFSSEDVNHSASKTVDGSMSSDWYPNPSSPTPDAQWIKINLAQSYFVCQVKIYWWDNTHHASNFTIQASTNNTTWTTAANITGNTQTTTTHNFTTPVNAQYILLDMTQRAVNWSSYGIREIQVFEATNQAPSISIVSPENNYSIIAGDDLIVNVNATDADGSITKVALFRSGFKIAEDMNVPYSFTLNNANGMYSLTTRAYDNFGDSTTSSLVSVNTVYAWSTAGNLNTVAGTNFIGTKDNTAVVFGANGSEKMRILPDGFVGIGTATAPNAEARLAVNGAIYAKKLKVTQQNWADYVFDKDYRLMKLPQVEAYIKKHNHLPDVPSAKEVQQNGTDVAEMQAILLRKIEELTLYIIEQDRKITQQQKEIDQLKRK
jgi:hypothetical protein